MDEQTEFRSIIETFAACGWDVLDGPAQTWLKDPASYPALLEAIKAADLACGSCGCELDPLYKRALALAAVLAH